ncbi:MAG: hypothetical protein N2593_03020 [Patescibacteria group bacterium]|nr:hypothetical protein [Patescibacteria group bacterium]
MENQPTPSPTPAEASRNPETIAKPIEMVTRAIGNRIKKEASQAPPEQRERFQNLYVLLGIKEDGSLSSERTLPFNKDDEIIFDVTLRDNPNSPERKKTIIMIKEQITDENNNPRIQVRTFEAKKEENGQYTRGEEVFITITKDEKGNISRIDVDDEKSLKEKEGNNTSDSSAQAESPQQQPTEQSKEEDQKPAETPPQKKEMETEEIQVNNILSEEDAKEFTFFCLTEGITFSGIKLTAEQRQTIRQILKGEEPNPASLESLASAFGFVTPSFLREAFTPLVSLEIGGQKITDLEAIKGYLGRKKEQELTPEEQRVQKIIQAIDKIDKIPQTPILSGKEVIEILQTINPDFFGKKNADDIKLDDLLKATYEKIPGKKRQQIKEAVSQQTKTAEVGKSQTNQNQTEPKTEQQPPTEEEILKKEILRQLGIEPANIEGLLNKSLASIIDEHNQQIEKAEEGPLTPEKLKDIADLFSEHKELIEEYRQLIEKRLNTAGKIGLGFGLVLLMLIYASSKDKQGPMGH